MGTSVQIGIIGDYDENKPSHIATNDALIHAASVLSLNIDILWCSTIDLAGDVEDAFKGFDALFCAPGSPYQSCAGALNAIRYARENDIPFIGTCGGFQHAVMEFAQNVLGIPEVYHEEYDAGAGQYLIKALTCSLAGQMARIFLEQDSVVRLIYGQAVTEERYTCNYGLNSEYLKAFTDNGFQIAGADESGAVRVMELPEKQFYIITLFQPQLSSTPEQPHPLFVSYLKKALANKES